MLIGAVLVALGMLIVAVPEFLSYIIGFFLISLGAVSLITSYRWKKLNKQVNNPYVDFFIRF
jgi:uncharacterized membrane protein HdeD (DUF308 family)